tara:strand:- start:132 stop:827 length:696 start_codon:yes stop_codon:yes gene_type:complete
MKNILLRGGIEFLAVLLGITGSFWIDELQENKKLTIEVNQALYSIIQELNEIKNDFNRVLENYEKQVPYYKMAIEAENLENTKTDELDIMNWNIQSPIGININTLTYESIKISGILYKIDNENIKNGIMNIYEEQLRRYTKITDYEWEYQRTWDQFLLSDVFQLRNDESSWNWFLNWDNPMNFDAYKNNIEFKNKLIALRDLKKIVVDRINIATEEIEKLITLLNQYLNDN